MLEVLVSTVNFYVVVFKSTLFLQNNISSENSTVKDMRITATRIYTEKVEYEQFYTEKA